MSYKLSFGKYEGKTFEWVFFNAPSYAEWIIEQRIHRQEHNMDETEGAYFAELFRRASSLQGTCPHCKERPISCMGLTRIRATDVLGHVSFYCEECEYVGGSVTEYHPASFFVEAYQLDQREQKVLTHSIKELFIGTEGNLTHAKMEAFFRDNQNFGNARPFFFQVWENELAR